MTPSRLSALMGATVSTLRADQRPDAELLSLFLDAGDHRAFQALLVRHAPAVRAACRGWLRAEADLDDAAQATFLVLVERARTIRNPAALGPWLYRVAVTVARRLKRRLVRERPALEDLPDRTASGDAALRDLLDEEVSRLPEKYRLPVQLCYAAGLTTAEAADRLGWPKGTVLTRLAWARKRLQVSLTRRGVAPAAVASLLTARLTGEVNAEWARATAWAAKCLLAGAGPAGAGVSARTASLTQGVVRAMVIDRIRWMTLAALVLVGLAGLGLHRWASASDEGPGKTTPRSSVAAHDGEDAPVAAVAGTKEKGKADDSRQGPLARRREAVIRVPNGSFVKEVDAQPHGSGRVTWTYEEERVLGRIEGSVMGVEFELATEAEYSLSSNGTIYGVLTSVRLDHLRLPDIQEFEKIKPFVGLWTVVEPVITEMATDLPFSYRFRVQGDRLIITNFRMLLAGPNPLGKLGGVLADGHNKEGLAFLAYFQALGTAVEGTYALDDGKEQSAPAKRPLYMKPRGRDGGKARK